MNEGQLGWSAALGRMGGLSWVSGRGLLGGKGVGLCLVPGRTPGNSSIETLLRVKTSPDFLFLLCSCPPGFGSYDFTVPVGRENTAGPHRILGLHVPRYLPL